MNRRDFLIALGLSLLAAGCVTTKFKDAIETDICSLIEKPSEYTNRIVAVSGVAKPAHSYNIDLSSEECGGKVITLLVPGSMENDPAYDALSSLLWTDQDEVENQVQVRVIGKFIWRPDAVPAWLLSLRKIESAEKTGAGVDFP